MTKPLLPILKWCGRWSSVLVIALAAIVVTVVKPYHKDIGPPIRSDGAGYHIWTYAILKGDLSFSWHEGKHAEVSLYPPNPSTGRLSAKYPPGVALLRLPAMVFVTDAGRNGVPYSSGEHWVCLGFAALALIFIAAMGLDTCYRLGVSPVWANVAVFLLTFGTGVFHFGTFDASFSHINSALLAAALVWVAARAVSLGRPLPVAVVIALVVGLLETRLTNILMVGVWVLACILWSFGGGRNSPGLRTRAVLGAAVGTIIGVALTLALNHYMLGRYTLNTYLTEGFAWDDPKLLLVLYGERWGLFRIYPTLAIAVLAGLIAPRARVAAACLVVLIVLYTVLYGFWSLWQLGDGFGHRGFVETVPFAVPVLALALASLPRAVSIALTFVGALATAYTVVQMWQYWNFRPFIPLAELIAIVTP
jgi:hypothetical protein